MRQPVRSFHQTLFITLVVLGLSILPTQAQQYYLSLAGQHLQLPNRTLYVEQVVDGRPDKSPIGIVYRGLDNRPAAVLFRDGLETELTAFLQKQLPSRPTDHSVVLCLRQLRVSEVLNGFTEEASADLAADIYAHLPDGYHFMQSVAARTANRALETTSQHGPHIALLLQQCLGQVKESSWQAAAGAPTRGLPQLAADEPTQVAVGDQVATAPAILQQLPRKGIYQTFAQFLANKPVQGQEVLLDTVRRKYVSPSAQVSWQGAAKVKPVVRATDGQRIALKDVWGFSDGQQVYVRHQNGYFPLVRQRNFFTFVGEAQPDLQYAKARMTAQARAGLVGVATVREQDHTGEPTGYAVDMRTGQSAPYPDPMRPYPGKADTAYVYVYRLADEALEPVPVFVGGQQVGQLRPNEYLEIPWPYFARIMSLGVKTPTTYSAQLFIPNVSQLNYIRVTTNRPTATRPIQQLMPVDQGERELDAIDKLSATSPK